MAVAVIGGGPAGLAAAEMTVGAGAKAVVFEQKKSLGRKFLVAGSGGLNLTHGEKLEIFLGRYSGSMGESLPSFFTEIIRDFSPKKLREWAGDLGIETFEQRTGRIYPRAMKAAEMLHRWRERLQYLGVEICVGHKLVDLRLNGRNVELRLDGEEAYRPFSAVVLALGGGSWPQTGSDGNWVDLLQRSGIKVYSLEAANCGWECAWPEELALQIEGKPLKNVAAKVSGNEAADWFRGEIMLTRYGLEGGLIYHLGRDLRIRKQEQGSVELLIDLKPDVSEAALVRKMESVRRAFLQAARERWRLPGQAVRLLEQYGAEVCEQSAEACAKAAKSLVIPLKNRRPLEEAISSIGGVSWEEVTDSLMLHRLPGVFVAGEMLNWEAPTGGYLLQGCFATGRHAGTAAARHRKND